MTSKPDSCAECGNALVQPHTGRPRSYCSAPCRRLAERKLKVAEQVLARARRQEQTARGRLAAGWSNGKEAKFWAEEIGRCEAALAELLRGAGDDEGSGEAGGVGRCGDAAQQEAGIVRYRNVSVIPGKRQPPPAAEPSRDQEQDRVDRGEAAIWSWLHKAVVENVPPEPLDAEMAANLATVLLVVLTENVRHQLGLEPEHARAAAVGWIAAKAQQTTTEGEH